MLHSRFSRGSMVVIVALVLAAATLLWTPQDRAPLPEPPGPATTAPAAPLASPSDSDSAKAAAADSPAPAAPDAPRTSATMLGPQLTGRLVQGGQPLPNVVLRLYTMAGYVPTATDRTVTTAGDGTFATAGLPTNFWLAAEAPSVPADWRTSTTAPLRADVDLGDLAPPVALALDVQVGDANGHPVANPHCWLARSDFQVELDARDARAPRLVSGDANGRVQIDRLHPGPLHLKVSADGFAMVQKVTELDATPRAAPLKVTLTRGRRLDGRVLDWSGKPMPGALVSGEGRKCVTDTAGAFTFDAFGGAEALRVDAKGHKTWWPHDPEPDYAHIQLERSVVLRGVVRGGNAATSIVLAAAPNVPEGVPWPGPHELFARLLPVASDGTFAIDGLAPSDFIVHARSEGLGASAGQRVALRGDAVVELTIDPTAVVALRVVDGEGRPVESAEVVGNLSIVEYPSLFGPHATEVPNRVFSDRGCVVVAPPANPCVLPAPRDEPLAIGVRSPGFLTAVRTFAAGQVPAELTIELVRCGAVRGDVRGGRGPAYSRSVSLWPVAQDPLMQSHKASITSLVVDAQGRFQHGELPPGEYFAAVDHYGLARIGHRPDEQVGAVPLVDEDEDLRTQVAFTVQAGATTELTLEERPLGTLRGRVTMAGRPVAGAWVVAARPGAKQWVGLMGDGEEIDWDSELDLKSVAGQCSGADGSFTFLYRDGGLVELRVRHTEAAATMPPVVVDLPTPGDDVHRDLEIALGGIRGRFVASVSGANSGRAREAVLFPLAKAARDPFYMTDYSLSRMLGCKRCALDAVGSFSFAHVPDGEWVVRVTDGWSTEPARRRVLVAGGEVDLGELREAATVITKLAWQWPPETPARRVFGIWLYEARGRAPTVWVATRGAGDAGGELVGVVPGKYLGVVFGGLGEDARFLHFAGQWGITGTPLSEPFAFEIQSDGTSVPASIVLAPAPAK